MFNLILMVGSFGLFMLSIGLLVVDLLSKKRNKTRNPNEKIPKLSKYSFFFILIALLLLVFVSFTYLL